MFGFGFYDVLIIAGILGVQYFLSTRNSVYWGALIPAVYVVWRTWVFIAEDQKFLSYVFILLLGLAFLIGEWHQGRKAHRKKIERELELMKSQDMK